MRHIESYLASRPWGWIVFIAAMGFAADMVLRVRM